MLGLIVNLVLPFYNIKQRIINKLCLNYEFANVKEVYHISSIRNCSIPIASWRVLVLRRYIPSRDCQCLAES